MMRNLMLARPSGELSAGDPRVGIPSEDIPEGSIAETLAAENPGDLVRIFVPSIPQGTVINEDGSYTGTAPKWWYEYVNGEWLRRAGETLNWLGKRRSRVLAADEIHQINGNFVRNV